MDTRWQISFFSKSIKKKLKFELLNKYLGVVRGQKCLLITWGDSNGKRTKLEAIKC